MLTPKASKSDWRRNDIFNTRCSSHGRLCNVIIDGGSCENLVSKEMVKKLYWKCYHTQSYIELLGSRKEVKWKQCSSALFTSQLGKTIQIRFYVMW